MSTDIKLFVYGFHSYTRALPIKRTSKLANAENTIIFFKLQQTISFALCTIWTCNASASFKIASDTLHLQFTQRTQQNANVTCTWGTAQNTVVFSALANGRLGASPHFEWRAKRSARSTRRSVFYDIHQSESLFSVYVNGLPSG